MGLIRCSECGKEISGNAEVCPNCGNTMKKTKKKKHGCLAVILFVIIFFGGIGAVFMLATGQNSAIQKSVSGVSDDSEYITLEEYNAIETGMTYEDVTEIVGSAGTISSQVESGGTKIVIVTWYGNGVAGSNANVTFTNNKVTGKAQVGLK